MSPCRRAVGILTCQRWNHDNLHQSRIPFNHQFNRQVSHCEDIKFYINWANDVMASNSSLLTSSYLPMFFTDHKSQLLLTRSSNCMEIFFLLFLLFAFFPLPKTAFRYMKVIIQIVAVCKNGHWNSSILQPLCDGSAQRLWGHSGLTIYSTEIAPRNTMMRVLIKRTWKMRKKVCFQFFFSCCWRTDCSKHHWAQKGGTTAPLTWFLVKHPDQKEQVACISLPWLTSIKYFLIQYNIFTIVF